MEKPKVGLLLLSGEWFSQIGANKGCYKNLPDLIEKDAQEINKSLGEYLDIVNPGIVNSREKLNHALKKFKEENINLLLICYLIWGEDYFVIEALKELPEIPLLLWCYSPFQQLPRTMNMVDLFRSSGPVGAVQASGPLKRMGKNFGFVFGSHQNKETIKKIVDYSQAAKLAAGLKKMTIGILPSECNQMSGTFVDEFRLRKELGPEIKYISVNEYHLLAQKIPEEIIKRYVKELKNSYKICGVNDKSLFKSARASLGLAKVVEKFNLDALALQDLDEELHQVFGLRPCLYVPSLFEKAVVSMEADVGAAVALLILKKLTGKPPMYTEIFTFDEKENTILAGHAGIHNLNLAADKSKIKITPDKEYTESEPESAWMQFIAKPGKVTMLSLFCDVERFKMVISSGDSLPASRQAGPGKEKLDGSPHIYIKLKIPLKEFFERIVKTGMTQHWAIVHEDVVDKLEYLAEILGLEKVNVGDPKGSHYD